MTMAFSQGNSDHLFHCEINDGDFSNPLLTIITSTII
jgi:hypothetical protein